MALQKNADCITHWWLTALPKATAFTGVQDKHYDRYNHLDEKRAALETLYRVTTGASAEVAPISRAK